MPRKTKRTVSRKNKTQKRQKQIKGGDGLLGFGSSSGQTTTEPPASLSPPVPIPPPVPTPAPCEGWRKTFGFCKPPSVGGKKKSKKSKK